MKKIVKDSLVAGTYLLTCMFIVMLLTAPVRAEDNNSILLGGVSHHFKTSDYTNSNHNIVGGIYKDKYLVAYFKNSYDNDSFALAYAFQDRKPMVNIQLYVGLIRGYDKCFGKFSEEDKLNNKDKVPVCPFVAPAVTIETGYKVKPQFTLLGDALVLSARYDF